MIPGAILSALVQLQTARAKAEANLDVDRAAQMQREINEWQRWLHYINGTGATGPVGPVGNPIASPVASELTHPDEEYILTDL